MATIQYPDELPLPLREGYDLNHVSPLVRTPLDSGRARQRRRFTSVPSIVNVSWIMSQAQALIFESWFQSGIIDGAEWFDVTLSTPLGLHPIEARFAGMYSGPQLVGIDCWRFSADLETRERQVIDGSFPIFFPGILFQLDIFDIAMNREWPAD